MKAGLPKQEPKILERWQRIDLWRRLREDSQGRPPFVLHDGPPYANGHIHIGHLVEYIQTDIWVRFQKLRGNQCIYLCADDTHGTAIMMSAERENCSEEEFIGRVQQEHERDFAGFGIEFDNYGSTNSTENKALCDEFWAAFRAAGLVEQREVTQLFDPAKGIFLAFQYPVEVPGVNNAEFLRMAYNARLVIHGKEELDPLEFDDILSEKMNSLGMENKYKERSLNDGFSGGEKKKNEILQMSILQPKLAILDETDSGLDIDALRVIAEGVNKLAHKDNALILITHYQRFLDYIEPDHVHVMGKGKIVKSGEKGLALELEAQGYDWLTTVED